MTIHTAACEPDLRRTNGSLACAARSLLERTAAAVALVLLAPVLLGAALAIAVESGGPVLARERRTDARGRAFDLLGFRTALPPLTLGRRTPYVVAARTGTVGAFLQRTSIEHLPRLINLARGHISLFG